LEKFLESLELPRVAECMGLYYVILLRDESNMTGIRNTEVASNIEESLLNPVRYFLARFPLGDIGLASLEVGLQRVDAALSAR